MFKNPMSEAGIEETCDCFYYRYPRWYSSIPNKNKVSILKTGAVPLIIFCQKIISFYSFDALLT